MKHGAHGECQSIGTHWIAFHVNGNSVTYFDSFVAEHISEETNKFIGTKYIITNVFKILSNDLIMCGSFCTGFIDFMFKG